MQSCGAINHTQDWQKHDETMLQMMGEYIPFIICIQSKRGLKPKGRATLAPNAEDCKDGGFSWVVPWAERFVGVSAYMREKDETRDSKNNVDRQTEEHLQTEKHLQGTVFRKGQQS